MNEGNRVASVDGPEGAARVTPADRTRAEDAVPVATASDGDFERDAVATTGETSWAVPAERPRPLHDPDPYSTPPYAEPARPSAGAGAGETPGTRRRGDDR
ncbi:hypothetical protein [Streptomyces sp. NRRL WC-3744]|uniref:hypothetical protein n=1 Tax=Streptomyces sp. NRRL WC-3744 TaxID=1463935 RepID=UPI0004CB78FE|nr:hypothetical protein [Streptomyces sp. NRRL WC-3744]